MAAEDDGTEDDKPAGAERKSRQRRQRPPVTIDLTAERVADKAETPTEPPEAAKPEAETAEAGNAAVPPAEEKAEGEPAPAASAPRR